MRYRSFLFLVSMILLSSLAGCDKSPQKRSYTEKTTEPPASPYGAPGSSEKGMVTRHVETHDSLKAITADGKDPQAQLQEMLARGEDPHANLQNAPMISAEAKARLQEMMSSGQDPHAMLDPGQGLSPDAQDRLQQMMARGEDPHAFLKNAGGMPTAAVPTSGDAAGAMNSSMSNLTPELMASKGNASLSWTIPEGWKEKPAGGMRMASFTSAQNEALDVSIVALGGGAGGLSANINRWLGQVNLAPMSDAELGGFLSRQEKWKTSDGNAIQVVDLTTLKDKTDPSQSGILAGILQLPDQTIFIKMSGTLAVIEENRAAFQQFVQSLAPQQ